MSPLLETIIRYCQIPSLEPSFGIHVAKINTWNIIIKQIRLGKMPEEDEVYQRIANKKISKRANKRSLLDIESCKNY